MQLQSMPSLYYPALAHFSHSRTTELVQIPRRSVGGKYGSMYVIVHGMVSKEQEVEEKLRFHKTSSRHAIPIEIRSNRPDFPELSHPIEYLLRHHTVPASLVFAILISGITHNTVSRDRLLPARYIASVG